MLLPAATGFGLAEFVTLRSAWIPLATAIFTVAELSAGFSSCVGEAAVTVSLIIVPAVAVPLTVYFAVIVPVEPGGTLGLVQDTGAEVQVQVPPPAVTTATE